MQLFERKTLPVMLAAEAAECGLACLTMLARYHGHQVDVSTLRRSYGLSMSGMTLRNIMEVADRLSLGTRAIRIEMELLSKVRTPAILHWDFDHFVVLKSVGRKSAVIHDPARGKRTLPLSEVSKHFTGIALEVAPAQPFRVLNATNKVSFRSLWSNSKGFLAASLQVVAVSLALQLAAFIGPLYLQFVADNAIARGDLDFLLVAALGFGVVALLQAGISGLRNWLLQIFGASLSYQLVGNIVRHLLRLPVTFFEKRHIGDILSRVDSTLSIQEFFTKGVIAAFIDGAMATVAIAIMFGYSTLLGSIVFATTALSLIITYFFNRVMRDRTEEKLVLESIERSHILESVRANTTIKLMGREAARESAWRNHYAKAVNASAAVERIKIVAEFFQTGLAMLTTIAVIYFGARFVIENDGFSLGMLLAFLSFHQTFNTRIASLLQEFSKFQLLSLHLERVSDIVATERDVQAEVIDPVEVHGAIEMSGISFRYGFSDPLVLRDFELRIDVGEFVAIIGQSGCGKSTLLKIMLGLQPPATGTVLLDGVEATPGLFREWRRSVAVVSQDDRLLSGSIAENISFFDPDINLNLVEEAARKAQIHEDIQKLPMRYSSPVGDMGSSLSAGQRQRVLLARALYRDPSILVLDEGTANLDLETEEMIAEIVADLKITRVIVAHREALVRKADRVIDLQAEKATALEPRLLSDGPPTPANSDDCDNEEMLHGVDEGDAVGRAITRPVSIAS